MKMIETRQLKVDVVHLMDDADNTIKRGAKLAGAGTTILKFSKANQDLRFDVPVVGWFL